MTAFRPDVVAAIGLEPLTRKHARRLALITGGIIGVVMPVMIAVWIALGRINDWDVIYTARVANVSGMILLAGMLVAPFTLREYPFGPRLRGFVLVWFCVSPFFNAAWQLPLIIFRHTITGAEITAANLPRYISWWGYGSIDSHYGTVSQFMIASEMWWLVAMVIGIVGLVRLRRGATRIGYLLLGISGALQAYNASFYVVENGFVDGFDNVARDSWMGPFLYFGFAVVWVGAALTASAISFRMVLQSERLQND
jgi:hypothetical protein